MTMQTGCAGLQVTAILAAGHQLPFEVKMQNLDLPELQVRHLQHELAPMLASEAVFRLP